MSSRQLRVLHVVSPQPPGETGGVDQHVQDLAFAQARGESIEPQVVELGNKGYAARLAERGVVTHTLSEPYRLKVFDELAEVLQRQAVDVVHTHGYDSDLIGIGSWWRSGRRAALVATVHGLIWRPTSNLLKTLAMLGGLSLAADAVTATSSSRASWLRRLLTQCEVQFIANGVDLPSGRNTEHRSRSPQLLYVGRLSPEKRVDLVLMTCAALVAQLPNVSCRIVGSGAEEARLHQLADNLGIARRVEFLGLVDDVEAELRSSDVLLLLSDTEGTPRAVVEAMAVGLPVVATDVGGVGDLLHHEREGLLVPRRDVHAAAGATLRLLQDRDLSTYLADAAGLRYREEFTIDQMEKQIRGVYMLACQRRRRRGGLVPGIDQPPSCYLRRNQTRSAP